MSDIDPPSDPENQGEESMNTSNVQSGQGISLLFIDDEPALLDVGNLYLRDLY
ncbi:MAG TPA: hypothetical protein VN372_10270 [Methanospirillum sp.]|nr:hypothetical protein [Methanospirillum sp.]